MPKPGEIITNVACLVIDKDVEKKKNTDKNKKKTTTTTEEVEVVCDEAVAKGPDLWIKKTFSDGTTEPKVVKVGDEIEYKISFGNSGDDQATIVSLKDFLPPYLEYVHSEISLSSNPTNSTHTNGIEEDLYADIYDNITLNPGASGVLTLVGKLISDNQNSTYNMACIYLNDQQMACDGVLYKVGGLKIEKSVDKNKVYEEGARVKFTLKVTNTGKVPISGFTVTDALPDGLSFVSRETTQGFEFKEKSNILERSDYKHVLGIGKSVEITFTASVDVVGEYENFACVTHEFFTERGSYPYSPDNCDKAGVILEKNYCKAPVIDKIPPATTRGSAKVNVRCDSDGGAAIVKIVCGNGTSYTSSNKVLSYSQTCNYNIEGNLEHYNVSCIVDEEEMGRNKESCKKSITIEKKEDETGACGDSVATHREDCDCEDGTKDCSIDKADLNRNRNEVRNYDKKPGDRCVNCKIMKDEIHLVEPMLCFNVNNGSISINKGEMLPFYRNIERVNNEYYTNVGGYDNALKARE